MTRILLVEDDFAIVHSLQEYLNLEGFASDHASGQIKAEELLKTKQYQLLLLDVSLKDGDGFAVCDMAQKIQLPVIFLSASSDEETVVRGLNIGADDYITKPFDTELLLYKIKAILQRSTVVEEDEQEHFKISNIEFDSVLRQLKVHDAEYKLSPKENELLKMLCMHRNDFMPRDLALRKIWKKENYFTARSMDVYIAKLRKLLKDDEGLEIINVHGEGFRLLVKN